MLLLAMAPPVQDITHYDRLGVSRGADVDTVRQAFRRLSKAVHPDKNPGRMAEATEAQQIVIDAHQTLRCDLRRQAYMLCSSWQQYEAALARAESEAAQRRSGEARERQERRAEKRQREEWGGRSAEGRADQSDRSHRHRSKARRGSR